MEAVTALQDCILDIKTWMTTDKLKLNDDKTELIVIGSRAQLDKISITELSIDHVKVSAGRNVAQMVRQPSVHENRHQQDLSIGTLPSA